MNKRVELRNTNFIKTMMMFAVVVYHSCALWNNGGWFNQRPAENSLLLTTLASWLSSFHTYTFVFVSGYLFYYLKYEKMTYTSLEKTIAKRANRLLVPFFFVTLLWTIPFHIVYYGFDAKDILKKYVLMTAPDQLWFLVMLFVLWCIFYLISDRYNNLGLKEELLVICVLMFWPLLNYYIRIPSVFQITAAVRHFPMFAAGFLMRKYDLSDLYKKENCIMLVVLSLVLFVVDSYLTMQNILLYKLFDSLMQLTNALTVFVVANKASIILKKSAYLQGMYQILEKYNFAIYLFHQQIIYTVITILNGKVSCGILFLLNIAISIVVSVVLAMLLSKKRKIAAIIGVK